MFEKVTPAHPDKIADRVAGAIVDLAYEKEKDPKIAVEVLIGHGVCHIIIETSVILTYNDIASAVHRIAGEKVQVDLKQYPQDKHLAANQDGRMRCGDNGIFRGVPVTREQELLTALTKELYERYHADGKCIKDGKKLVICQSNADLERLKKFLPKAKINPLGPWAGGLNVDSGATNRKLGSDMGDAVTGGGLHGKDLSKADVTMNIVAFLFSKESGLPIEYSCAIGDEKVLGVEYEKYVEIARSYIKRIGGFEKFAEWGLIR